MERDPLREAAQAVVDAWVDDESGMETFDPALIDALSEALDHRHDCADHLDQQSPHDHEFVAASPATPETQEPWDGGDSALADAFRAVRRALEEPE